MSSFECKFLVVYKIEEKLKRLLDKLTPFTNRIEMEFEKTIVRIDIDKNKMEVSITPKDASLSAVFKMAKLIEETLFPSKEDETK